MTLLNNIFTAISRFIGPDASKSGHLLRAVAISSRTLIDIYRLASKNKLTEQLNTLQRVDAKHG